MSEENEVKHRLLKYLGNTLVEVLPDVLEAPARVLIDEYTDPELGQYFKSDTMDCSCKHDTVIDDAELALMSDMSLYSFNTSLGVLNVVAPDEVIARKYLVDTMKLVGLKTGQTYDVNEYEALNQVHFICDLMGLMHSGVSVDELVSLSTEPLEE